MIFTWHRNRRRRKLLAQPFPPQWLEYLHKNVAHYAYLSEAEQDKLRDDLRVFIAEKNWEGCKGLQITDELRVTIAAQACLLVLNLPVNHFERVKTILVYPSGFLASHWHYYSSSPEDFMATSGQSWYRGPVILAWEDVLAEGRNPGHGKNIVYHEFAHQLDMLDGEVNGTPPLDTPQQYERWREVMTREYERLIRASEQGKVTLLDDYGATNEGEFFAVATECFFDKPAQMQARHPQLYELLRDYYRQDPAARCWAKRPGGPASSS